MLNPKVVLVTGGTSGIGKETVKKLISTGAQVISTARTGAVSGDMERGSVEYMICDLASLASIKAFAEEFKRRYQRLDVLINNAGVLPQGRQESKDGNELNFAVNFLAPFLLTNLLLPLLKRSAPSRVVNVSSSMHGEGRIAFEDLQSKKSFNKYAAYAQSKLALILFTKKLAQDLRGSGVAVNAVNPGVVGTEMTLQNVRMMNPLVAFFYKRTLLTPEQGAEASVYLATSPDVENMSGEYFDRKKIARASPQAFDMAAAEKLWDISAKLVGL